MVFTVVVIVQGGLMLDTRFDKPVTFDSSLTQITDFCAQASSISGVPIKVDKGVADLKVDVFVENKPLKEVLARVAKALNCEWVPMQDGYRFEMMIPNMNRERNFNLAEDEVNRKFAETTIWACMYCAKVTPLDKKADKRFGLLSAARRNEVLKPFEQAWQAAQEGKDNALKAQARAEYGAMSTTAGNWELTSLGRALLQMDKAGLEQFWQGTPLVASTFPGSKLKLDPSEASTRFFFNTGDSDAKQPEPDLFYILRYRPDIRALRASLNTYIQQPPRFGGGMSTSKTGGMFSGSSSNNEVDEQLKPLAFYQDLKPWMDSEATSAAFSQIVKSDTKTWPSVWSIGRRRLGDHLRWFHLATGIPVVAQADRSCLWNWAILNRPYADAKTYIKTLMEDTQTYCQSDGGYLVARNYRYWSHRRHEAPEQTWKWAESQTRPLTMLQLFKLAGAFREDQLRTEDIGYPLSTLDVTQFSYAYDSLNFLSRLSKDQLQACFGPTGVALADLGPGLAQEAANTIANLVSDSGMCSYEMAKMIVAGGFGDAALQQMRIRLSSQDYKNFTNYVNEIKEGNTVIQPAGQQKRPVTSFTVAFGATDKESVTQSFNIDK